MKGFIYKATCVRCNETKFRCEMVRNKNGFRNYCLDCNRKKNNEAYKKSGRYTGKGTPWNSDIFRKFKFDRDEKERGEGN